MLARPAAPGVLLIACTLVALIAANSAAADAYADLLATRFSIGIGPWGLAKPLSLWINDGLMAIFFFAIGLEIKRELLVGQLSSVKRASLPILAAVGGMLVPAAIFASMNHGTHGAHGWAIPMATDIAFAVGVLSLLGNRIPPSLKVFLLALAIVDDLGAVLVIAIFYTETISLVPLAIAIGGWLVAIGLNAARFRAPGWYAVIGIVVWLGMLKSGVHATIAGVLMGFAIPVKRLYDGPRWLETLQGLTDRDRTLLTVHEPDSHEELGARQEVVHAVEEATERAQSPLVRLEHGLAPWIAFAIMPIFAVANAGVPISMATLGAAAADGITWGVFLGLFVGKQIGVFLFSWLAVRLNLGERPAGTSWRQLYGVAILAGIGFTMSLFVTELSFPGHAELADMAKMAILAASFLAGGVGYLWLRAVPERAAAQAG